MSDLVVLALKLLFLALLWLFVLFVGNVIRTDMFGRKLATNEVGELQPVAELRKQKKPRGRAKAMPHQLRVSKGKQEGLTLPLGDGIKIVLAAGLFPLLWRLMTRNGLAPRSTTDSAVIDLTDKSDKTAVRSDQEVDDKA